MVEPVSSAPTQHVKRIFSLEGIMLLLDCDLAARGDGVYFMVIIKGRLLSFQEVRMFMLSAFRSCPSTKSGCSHFLCPKEG